MQSPPFLILAIFGFPLNTPLPTRHVRSPLTTAQRAPCQKRGFGAARYQVAREARFRATQSATLSKNATSRFDFWRADNDMMLNSAASTRPPFRLSHESKAHRKARLFHTSGEMVPRGTPPPTGVLFAPLTPLQGEVPEERGHSGTSLSSRARSAVSRDAESPIYTL